mmetsp:Transcript_24559/g.48343  ORF Transcript_24559/g.48343 Transcript_24559/m.48343 type:complete len:248 (+) Transcript_24559:15-758(+)
MLMLLSKRERVPCLLCRQVFVDVIFAEPPAMKTQRNFAWDGELDNWFRGERFGVEEGKRRLLGLLVPKKHGHVATIITTSTRGRDEDRFTPYDAFGEMNNSGPLFLIEVPLDDATEVKTVTNLKAREPVASFLGNAVIADTAKFCVKFLATLNLYRCNAFRSNVDGHLLHFQRTYTTENAFDLTLLVVANRSPQRNFVPFVRAKHSVHNFSRIRSLDPNEVVSSHVVEIAVVHSESQFAVRVEVPNG